MPKDQEGKTDKEGKPTGIDLKSIIQMLFIPLLLLLGTQILTTVLPIMYGPVDTADFNIIVDPPAGELGLIPPTMTSRIIVEDSHRYIRPYGHSVHLEAITPDNLNASFGKNNVKPPFETEITVWPINRSNKRRVEIVIMGMGGDGKRRNTTLLVSEIVPLDKRPNTRNTYVGTKPPFNRK
jgi:hypothetical protein